MDNPTRFPSNAVHLRCYESAGFNHISNSKSQEWNSDSSNGYLWLKKRLIFLNRFHYWEYNCFTNYNACCRSNKTGSPVI